MGNFILIDKIMNKKKLNLLIATTSLRSYWLKKYMFATLSSVCLDFGAVEIR